MNISALCSQASFSDVMSYHVVTAAVSKVKMGNVTDGVLRLSVGTKINATSTSYV